MSSGTPPPRQPQHPAAASGSRGVSPAPALVELRLNRRAPRDAGDCVGRGWLLAFLPPSVHPRGARGSRSRQEEFACPLGGRRALLRPAFGRRRFLLDLGSGSYHFKDSPRRHFWQGGARPAFVAFGSRSHQFKIASGNWGLFVHKQKLRRHAGDVKSLWASQGYLGGMDWDVPKIIPRQPGRRKLWLTADEHYGHRRILQYQSRPFSTVEEMDDTLVRRHNEAVGSDDVVIHIGDFSFGKGEDFARVARKLNGTHFFMDGSHDRSMREFFSRPEDFGGTGDRLFLLPKLFEFTFRRTKVVLCHYAMHSWWASHYPTSSVHFHGHSHGRFDSPKQAVDVGVDTNEFYPYEVEAAIAKALGKVAPSAP